MCILYKGRMRNYLAHIVTTTRSSCMNKNILVLTGSPRKNGNSNILAAAFVEGASAKGHAVTVFDTSKNIGGCKACDTCWSKGQACSFTDVFTELEPLLEQADAIVLATPLYWFGFSAQIKTALDRLYAYISPNTLRPLKIKECALLACAGDTDSSVFDGLTHTYEIMLKYMNWSNSGMLTVPGVMEKGDILKTDAQDKARQLGMSF